jgi:hypothetical protein
MLTNYLRVSVLLLHPIEILRGVREEVDALTSLAQKWPPLPP